jgi:hypothetical protein
MAQTTQDPPTQDNPASDQSLAKGPLSNTPSHEYHAEAHGLSGHFHHPVYQRINKQAHVMMKGERGGHVVEKERGFTLEGVVSFQNAHTRVSGSRSLKNKGWITLSTSIVEGLNVLEVITADRIVSQVSTEHALDDGHVPDVTFLGTQFVNLRLSGFEIKPKFNFGICGPKPAGRTPYVLDVEFLAAAKKQVSQVNAELTKIIEGIPELKREEQVLLQRHRVLLKELLGRYSDREKVITGLEPQAKALKAAKPSGGISGNGSHEGNGNSDHHLTLVTCSLIKEIVIEDSAREAIPGLRTAGNILFIPEFGAVALGEVEVSSSPDQGNYFHLKMLDMDLGCVGDGKLIAAAAATNGRHNP